MPAPTTAQLRDLEPAVLRAPWALYARWRAAGPVAEVPELGGWAVTDFALAAELLRDHATWSSDSIDGPLPADHARWTAELAEETPELAELVDGPVQALLGLDPPDHTRLRKILVPFFSAASIRRLAPLVDGLVSTLAPRVLAGEPVDFVADYAHALPLHTVATLLGLPRGEWDRFGALAAAASTSNPHLETRAALRARLHAELALARYFAARIAELSPGDDPDGLLAALHAAVADGRATLREAVGLCREVLVAGADSTVNHLSSAVLMLAQDPALHARVRGGGAALEAFVEEALRLEPPFAGFWRRARSATTLGGVTLPAGALVLVPFAALNRDPAVFRTPDAVDLERPTPRRHLTFGQGIHFCVGAPLARLESLATFRALLPGTRRIDLLVDPAELVPRPSIQDRGVVALPVRFVAGART